MAEYISFQPSDFFNTVLYTGNNTDDRALTGVGFAPDFGWFKERSGTDYHYLVNTVMGANHAQYSNTAAADDTSVNAVKAFGADGYTLGVNTGVNENLSTYVNWNWKMGTTSGISGGTITPSSYSINTTAKQGIYKWSGTSTNGTIAHGLGATPQMFLVKQTNGTAGWQVYHQGMGPTEVMYLNSNAAPDTSSTVWNDTAPTSTLLSLGTNAGTNTTGNTYIGYAFCNVSGYSHCGTYNGNGNADGTFVYLPFKPGFILIKRQNGGAAPWCIFDSKRLGYNRQNKLLVADTDAAETTPSFDIFSNGFKPLTTDGEWNGDGSDNNYIYLAFADKPLVSSNDIPTVAT